MGQPEQLPVDSTLLRLPEGLRRGGWDLSFLPPRWLIPAVVAGLMLLWGSACAPPPLEELLISDAGALDSGERDAGLLDSSEIDSSELDSGELDSGELDSGVSDSGGEPTLPILEREPQPLLSCAEELSARMLMDCDMAFPVALDSSVYAVAERGYANDAELSVASVEASGELRPIALLSEVYAYGYEPAIASSDVGLATIWVEDDAEGSALHAALIAPDGRAVIPPHEVAGTRHVMLTRPALVATDSGFVAMWISFSELDVATLALAHLDDNLAPTAPPVTVLPEMAELNAGRPINQQLLSLVRLPEGFAVAWAPQSWGAESPAFLLMLSPAGEALGSPRAISRPTATRAENPRLIYHEDRLLAAWTECVDVEGQQGDDGQESSVVVVAEIDPAAGTPRAFHPLQRVERAVVNVHPSFVGLDGAVGLYWSAGPWSSWGAGSYGTNSISFVALAADGLVPASEVVTHPQEGHFGGLFRPLAVRVGERLVSTLSFSFHAGYSCGLASIRCTP